MVPPGLVRSSSTAPVARMKMPTGPLKNESFTSSRILMLLSQASSWVTTQSQFEVCGAPTRTAVGRHVADGPPAAEPAERAGRGCGGGRSGAAPSEAYCPEPVRDDGHSRHLVSGHGFRADHGRSAARPRHHHVRPRAVADASTTSGGWAGTPRSWSSRWAASSLLLPLVCFGLVMALRPAAAAGRRADAAGRVAGRDERQPVQPPVPRRRRAQRHADRGQLGDRDRVAAADHQPRHRLLRPRRQRGPAVRQGGRGLRDRADPGRRSACWSAPRRRRSRRGWTGRCGSAPR